MFICKPSGLTIIELIISLCILSILALLAIPTLQDIFHRAEAKYVQQTFSSAIQLGKIKAITQRQYIVICASADLSRCQNNQWNKGIIMFTDLNKNRVLDQDEQIIWSQHTQLKYGHLTWASFGTPHLITFSERNGLPIDSNGSLTYCSHTHHHFKWVLSKMGHTRVESIANC